MTDGIVLLHGNSTTALLTKDSSPFLACEQIVRNDLDHGMTMGHVARSML